LTDADAVFFGRAVASEYILDREEAGLTRFGLEMVEATIQVERWWKGGHQQTATFMTPLHGSACGVYIQLGAWYIVEATQNSNGRLVTSYCSRTDFIYSWNEGKEWPEDLPGGYEPRSSGTWSLVLGAFILLATLIIVVLRRLL
jgi:hypothetical protein